MLQAVHNFKPLFHVGYRDNQFYIRERGCCGDVLSLPSNWYPRPVVSCYIIDPVKLILYRNKFIYTHIV